MDLNALGAALFDWKAALLFAAVFVALERLLPLNRRQRLRRAGWGGDLVYLTVNAVVIRLTFLPVLALVVLSRPWLAPPAVTAAIAAQPLWAQVVEVVLVADFGFYWMHRLLHAVPLLWRLHAVHHSIEQLDWLASYRVHPLDQAMVATAQLAPVLLLGFSDAAIALYALAYGWHSLLLHANVRLKLGGLGRVVATPEFHHWHHSRAAEAIDKNFAGQVALWDLLFGTLHLPGGRSAAPYGTETAVPAGYVDQLAFPFRRPASRPWPGPPSPARGRRARGGA